MRPPPLLGGRPLIAQPLLDRGEVELGGTGEEGGEGEVVLGGVGAEGGEGEVIEKEWVCCWRG